jgi:hypothetical protein
MRELIATALIVIGIYFIWVGMTTDYLGIAACGAALVVTAFVGLLRNVNRSRRR